MRNGLIGERRLTISAYHHPCLLSQCFSVKVRLRIHKHNFVCAATNLPHSVGCRLDGGIAHEDVCSIPFICVYVGIETQSQCMGRNKMPKRSIRLLVCTLFVLSIGLSATGYAKKPDNGNGNGKPDKSGTSCEINFCIDFDNNHEVTSDGFDGGEYCHGTDKVLVFTGKGPGFGFDTTQSGKGKTMSRYLNIDLMDIDLKSPHKLSENFEKTNKVVFKFDKSGDPSGLDLCLLETTGDVGLAISYVGLAISYEVEGAVDNSNTLTYGAPAAAPCGDPVTVTRTASDTWTIAGTTACLWDGQKDALVFKGERNRVIIGGDVSGLAVSFFATITEIQ